MTTDPGKLLQWLEPLKDILNQITLVAFVGLGVSLVVLLLPSDWLFFEDLIELRTANRATLLLVLLASIFTLLFKGLQLGLPVFTEWLALMRKVRYINGLEPHGKAIVKRYFTNQKNTLEFETTMLIDEMRRQSVLHKEAFIYAPLYRLDDAVRDYLKGHMEILTNRPQSPPGVVARIKNWIKQRRIPA